MNFGQTIKNGLISGILISLTACSSYGTKLQEMLTETQSGQFQKAETAAKEALEPDSKEQLLYYVELGVLKHLQGQYEDSNTLFAQAQDISDRLYTTRVSEETVVLLTNPTQRTYRLKDFEQAFIQYYQLLNYLEIAQASDGSKTQKTALDNARVMSRQIEQQLNKIAQEHDTYQEAKRNKDSFIGQLTAFFRLLNGDVFDPSEVEYRDDAWLRYLSATLYEKYGDLNEARVAYQQAAQLYENGFQTQYGLSPGMTQQAWFDTFRIMKQQGVWHTELQQKVPEKLTLEWQAKLKAWSPDQAQIILIEHHGLIAHREEMNMALFVNNRTRNMEIYPVVIGEGSDPQGERLWFALMYQDKGVVRFGVNISQDKLRGLIRSLTSKTLYLSPMWKEVNDLGIPQAVSFGLRVTVPYYNVFDLQKPPGQTLLLNQQPIEAPTLLSEAPSILAIQSQLYTATDDLYAALGRAIIKRQVVSSATPNGSLLRLLSDVATASTEAADTRNWLTLPSAIRLTRLYVPAGTHTVNITQSSTPSATPDKLQRFQRTFRLKSGDIALWKIRTFSPKSSSTTSQN